MLTYDTIIENLETGKHFSMQRWGDGELKCFFGYTGQNCDGVKYTRELRLMLQKSIDREIYMGVQPLARRIMPEEVEEFEHLIGHGMEFNADILHKASINGDLFRLFNALQGQHVVLVGPQRLHKLKEYFKFYHLIIPDEDCVNYFDSIAIGISLTIKDGSVVLYCASMLSNVLINTFHTSTITQIDCGSVFEPYVGHKNRTYHSEIITKLQS